MTTYSIDHLNSTQDHLTQLEDDKNWTDSRTSKEYDHKAAFMAAFVHWPTVSVVIPTLNEAKNLPHVLPRIPKWVHEVILVDGYSKDDTIAVARKLWPEIRVVFQEGKGKGAALRSGFAAATGDIIVMLDADGSTDPAEIPAFVGTLLSGADFAKGSRFLQGGGTADMHWFRRLGNWFLMMLVRLNFGGHYSDLCYGYNAFWKQTLPKLSLDADGFEIETLMNIRALQQQLRIAEVPSFEAKRVHGTSNLRTIPDGWRVLKTIMRERLSSPTAWAGYLTPSGFKAEGTGFGSRPTSG
jgi:glycosyltransferase involved in cell wall biosynthesis